MEKYKDRGMRARNEKDREKRYREYLRKMTKLKQETSGSEEELRKS